MEYSTEGKQSGYGKRPLWQWILLYLVIGAVVYGLVYYFVLAKKGNTGASLYGDNSSVPVASASPLSEDSGMILITKNSATKGSYLADAAGKTLYVFDKDTQGKSNCNDTCLTVWPPYAATGMNTALPPDLTTINRDDGTVQYAYKGKPLYYYADDAQPSDTNGDGVGGIWHLVKP